MQTAPNIPENRGQVSCSDGPPLLRLAWGWPLKWGLAYSWGLLPPTKATVYNRHLLCWQGKQRKDILVTLCSSTCTSEHRLDNMTAVCNSLGWLMSGVLMPGCHLKHGSARSGTAQHSIPEHSTAQPSIGMGCREQHFIAWHCFALSCSSSSLWRPTAVAFMTVVQETM